MIKYFTALVGLAVLAMGVALPMTASAQQGGSLAGTSWELTQYAVQKSAFVPAVGEHHPTIMFSNDGYVGGNAGCNSYGGPYTQSGDQLNIGTLISTLRACLDQGVTDQEHLILSVLSGDVAATVSGNQLTLSSPAGTLVFAAAASQPNGPGTPGMPQTGLPDAGWPLLLAGATILVALGLVVRLAVARE
ncbi:MAG TPA: META domain-containing protein [Chloroflexia bacterium]|nr:META domain-containing protein [Chloroflexia bacterium]